MTDMDKFDKELKDLIFSVLVITNGESYDKHLKPKILRVINKHINTILET